MSQLIRFLLKANLYFFIIFISFFIFALVFGKIWTIIPYIFLLFFFYDWNVSPKINKTWTFIETLPVSLMKMYFLRVVFPFIFCFIILFCLEIFKKTGKIDYTQASIDSLRQTSIFLLSSVLAVSLSGYILWIIVLNIIMFGLARLHFYIPCVLILISFYTYYLLSMYRLPRRKFLHFPLLICLIILILGNFFRDPVFKILLSVPIKPIQTYSAENLINDNAYIKHIKPEINFSFSFNKSPFLDEFQDAEDYYYDDKLLEKIESFVVEGNKCSLTCLTLARGIQGFSQEWNLERWSEYLKSPEEAKQIYVLEVLRGSESILFFNRIMQLAQSQNLEISNRAMALIQGWGINSLYDIPKTEAF